MNEIIKLLEELENNLIGEDRIKEIDNVTYHLFEEIEVRIEELEQEKEG